MINELLDKFYNGETSHAEERELLRLLEVNPSPEHEPDRRLLRALCAMMPDFGAMADRASNPAPRRIKWFGRLQIAAAVTILIATAGSLLYNPQPRQEELTVDQARETTIMALTAYNNAINRALKPFNP